jgi:DNA-binding MarR family transcriptional regulator
MHAIFFGLKRAWQSSLRVTRHALAAVGLTAARFDLLYAANVNPDCPTTQRKLRQALGVNRTTVSRMLTSLETLGLITRDRVRHGDRRTRIVRLTEEGRARVRAVMRRCVYSGAVQLMVDSALAPERWDAFIECLCAGDAVESSLRRIRAAFRDSGFVHYPWQPDD